MSRRKKYEEEYEDEDYEEVDEEEEEEEDEESTMERVIAFYEDELERLVRDDPYNQEKFDMVMKRLEQLKKCRAVDCQAAESLANKEQAQIIATEARGEKFFKWGQLAATFIAPALVEGIKSATARSQVRDVIDYEREGNIFKSGATPFIKKP